MKLEYDQCFYKYIEQKTKELFMSVHSVNGISQMQNAQGVSFGSSNQDDGSGPDIGKLLVGTVLVAAVAGVGIAGYKSGKTSALTKEGDGVLTTFWNGIKSWFGKNTQATKKLADGLSDTECQSLRKIASNQANDLSQADLDALFNNRSVIADEIKKTKVANNARKFDLVKELKNKDKAFDNDYVAKLNKLIDKDGSGVFELKGSSIIIREGVDETLLAKARRLGLITNDNKFSNDINDILNTLSTKYNEKHHSYQLYTSSLLNSMTTYDFNTRLTQNFTSLSNKNHYYTSRTFNKTISIPNTPNSYSVDQYLLDVSNAEKYLKQGQITEAERDNIIALARHTISQDNVSYTKYLLKNIHGNENTTFTTITEAIKDKGFISNFNTKYGTSFTTSTSNLEHEVKTKLLAVPEANSIGTLFGNNGIDISQLPQGWTIESNCLKFTGTNYPESIILNKNTYSLNNIGQQVGDGTTKTLTLTLDNIKEMFKSAATSTP